MKIVIERTSYDWCIEVLCWLAILATFAPLFFASQIGTNPVPMHFNAAGEVDSWSDSSMLWFLPILSIVIYIATTFVEPYYRLFNYPIKVTEENVNQVHKYGVKLVRHIKLITQLFFAHGSYMSYAIAIGKYQSKSQLSTYIFFAALAISILIFLIQIFRLRKA